MGRYSTLYKLPCNLYDDGSPVLIAAGALLKDNQIGRVLAQLKFKSLSAKEIRAIRVCVRAFDVSGDEIEGVHEFQYLDLSAVRGDEFGDRRAIPLPNPVARSFNVCVRSVLFADGSAWNNEYIDPWIPLPRPVLLRDTLGSEDLAAQYARETSENSKYAPLELDDLWYCACGSINKEEETFCPSCGVERVQIFNAMDEDVLAKKLKKWSALQEADSTVEQIHTKKKKSHLMKTLLILLPILIVLGAAAYAVTEYVLPMMAYHRAEEKLSLHDFDGAAEAFTALGDYADAQEMVLLARYGAAAEKLESGAFDEARTEFMLLGEYKDSPECVLKCEYMAAEKLLNAKKYDEARDAFSQLNGYSDSVERADEAIYNKALALKEAGSNAEAVELFTQVIYYSDASEQIAAIKQAEIDQVNRYIRQNKFDEAWEAYENLMDYEPEVMTRNDFTNPDGDICAYLDENTTGDKRCGVYRYLVNGYNSRKDVTVTARGIRLTDPRIAVYMAYGEPDEEGKFITNGGFYTSPDINEETKAAMLEECDHYVRYSYHNYRLYFYFDSEDKVSMIFYSNGDYFCSTPDPIEEPEEETK